MSETIKWKDPSDKEKTRLIIVHVMQMPCFDVYKDWVQAGSVHPVALCDNKDAPTWFLYYDEEEDGTGFDPLHSMSDAWKALEHTKHRASMIYLPDLDSQIAQASIWANGEFHLGCAMTMPEAICIAVLKAVGLSVEA